MRRIENDAFSNLSNLTYLDISYNKLHALGFDYMSNLPKLQALNISGNVQLNLLNVRDVFEITSGLRSLSIADITDLPLDIFVPLGALHFLNVSGCRLGNHTHQILEPVTMLKVRKLALFSCVCDCKHMLLSYITIIPLYICAH
jgi:Leucine-rich repeat (LRR) protein